MNESSPSPLAAALAEREPTVVYERELGASVERIWENVLDWEHLPYLHSQAFSSVEMHSNCHDHWHGVVGLAGSPGATAEIDVRLDRANLRYHNVTVAGVGAGSEIVTHLFPRSRHRTGIRVEFHLPWAPEGAKAAIGDVYRNLYEQLWDQDEAMMRERQRVVDQAAARTPVARGASVVIGRVGHLAARLPLDVELGGRRFRVVSVNGRLTAHDVRCPHLGGPLGELPMDGCEAVCPWHGYRFDVVTGRSSDGRGYRLREPAVVEIDACGGDVTLRLP